MRVLKKKAQASTERKISRNKKKTNMTNTAKYRDENLAKEGLKRED